VNIAHFLARTARVFPDRPALYLGAECLYDYRAFADRAARIGAYLQAVGLSHGDRVAVYSSNCKEYLEILYGIWWAGLTAVPVNAKLHQRELEYIVDDAQASFLVVGEPPAPDLQGRAAQLLAQGRLVTIGGEVCQSMLHSPPCALAACAPDDVAWLFYTSGTTGRPKGVMITHRNLAAMSVSYLADVDEVDPKDAIVYAAPQSHGAGLYNFVHVLRGARHVVPVSGGFDEAELVSLAAGVGRLSLFAAPTMLNRLVAHITAHGSEVDGFKTIVYGGGPMYVEDLHKAREALGNRLVQVYGQGESPMAITALSKEHLSDVTNPLWNERIASVGVAQSLVEVAGNTVVPGKAGEVLVRGDTVMAGYWRNESASEITLRGGWLWTGDVGSMDEAGFLTLMDRSKDMIISGGSNIYPREVEEVLLMHPSVTEVSVIGRKDEGWGEIAVAFVVASGSANGVVERELDALCLQNIARFKRPKEYHFVDHLPKNNYGKVLKTELRKRFDPS